MEFHFLRCSQKTIHTTPGSTPPRGLSALLKQLSVKSSVVFGCYGTSHHVTFKSMTIIKYCHTDQKQAVWIKPAFAAPFTGGKVLMCVVDQDRDEGKKKKPLHDPQIPHPVHRAAALWQSESDPLNNMAAQEDSHCVSSTEGNTEGQKAFVGANRKCWWSRESPVAARTQTPNPASSSLVLMILH